jgi:nucleotide-binding universal stress UspA family protein
MAAKGGELLTLHARRHPMSDTLAFKSILVPLDGSPFAEQALPLAMELAKRGDGSVSLVLVHHVPAGVDTATINMFNHAETKTRNLERTYLKGCAAKVGAAGVQVGATVLLDGPTAPSLAEHVRDAGIDLVVMATHGRGGIQRAWLGSVADQLIRSLKVPLLLIRPTEQATGPVALAGQVLVPVDASPLAEEVLDPAAKLAGLLEAEMSVLQVVSPVTVAQDTMVALSTAYDEELTSLRRQQAQPYVDGIAERLRGQGLRASGAAVVGLKVADTILSLARPGDVSIIALATHGRGGLQRLALGSIADKLVRGADVPVLVYHPTGTRKERRSNRRSGAGRGAGNVVV